MFRKTLTMNQGLDNFCGLCYNAAMKSRTKYPVGRDPHKGIPGFKTGIQKSRKGRKLDRKDKYGRREITRQIRGE